MENRELIPIEDLIREIWEYTQESKNFKRGLELLVTFNNFIGQKLDEPYYVGDVKAHPLNRFVATDLDGNILEKPNNYGFWLQDNCKTKYPKDKECREFQEAQKRVVFEGMIIDDMKDGNLWVRTEPFPKGEGIVTVSRGKVSCTYHHTIKDLIRLGVTVTEKTYADLME